MSGIYGQMLYTSFKLFVHSFIKNNNLNTIQKSNQKSNERKQEEETSLIISVLFFFLTKFQQY